MRNKNKKGQITIFVILAILIIVIVFILFYPDIKKNFFKTPSDFLPKECFSENVYDTLNKTLMQGGELKPSLYFNYKNISVAYVCYTSEWYKTCNMQKPFLKQMVETEIENAIRKDIEKCEKDMEDRLKAKGYDVKTSGDRELNVKIEPNRVVLTYGVNMQINKGEYSQTFDDSDFLVVLNSDAYNLLMIASSIQNYETRYGDSNIEPYNTIYPEIKTEKIKYDDGTKIYVLSKRETGERLQFAIRSLSWPPGYIL